MGPILLLSILHEDGQAQQTVKSCFTETGTLIEGINNMYAMFSSVPFSPFLLVSLNENEDSSIERLFC